MEALHLRAILADGKGCVYVRRQMGLSDISFAVSLGAAAAQVGVGVAMMQFNPPNKSLAKILFFALPALPLIAIAIWGYTERPSIGLLISVSIVVGVVVTIPAFELARWVDNFGEKNDL